MIFFGQRGKTLSGENVPGVPCPNCSSSNTMQIGVVGKYAHVYWIPFFPTGKSAVGVCTNCKKTLDERDMSLQMKSQASDLKSRTRTPTWFFSGLIILAGLATLISIVGKRDDEADLKAIASPAAGDKYHMKDDEGNYTILKVGNVVGDTVYVVPNEYSVNKSTGLYKIDKEENYHNELQLGIHKDKIKEMYAKKEIIEVE